jgi:CTP:molybdopterin cytidylyltransferase MocA
MIISIVIVDQLELHGKPACLVELGEETALEHLVRTVLRGPFGVIIVAAPSELSARVKEALDGFAVQHVEGASGQPLLAAALKFGRDYRERWERVMAEARAHFGEDADDDKRAAKAACKPIKGAAKVGWAGFKSSADVKVRGLARSFDRDGVMVFPADHPAISLELQAQMVEAFGREAADKGANAKPLAQAVHAGQRGYPIVIDLPISNEVQALSVSTRFDDWLLSQLPRIQDVSVQDAGAVSVLRSEGDYENICRLLKIKDKT